jgi:hypothetical protein
MIGRRLFWRIYLTLFASLALTAVLMALLWSAVGDTRVEGLRKLPSKLIAAAIPELDEPPGAIQAATARVAAAMSGDLTVIGADGQLLAVSGERLRRGTVSEDDDWDRPPAPNVPASNIRVFRLPDAASCWPASTSRCAGPPGTSSAHFWWWLSASPWRRCRWSPG